MKQIAQHYKSGELAVLDVPPPACRPGGVLVASRYSLISTGTEVMKVKEAGLSLAGKARARPEQVRQVLDTVAQQGPVAAYQKVMNRLDAYTPLGYSLSGTVIEVGDGAEGFHVGQTVACAGNEHALHAEVNWVPANLCVGVPDGVAPEHAAFATVGAIAMHGVRRSEPQLGESACVIGLGLVGQLAVQLLVAAGVTVVGVDTVAERCRLAEASGAAACDAPSPEGLDRLDRVLASLPGGGGADHVVIAAGGSSNGPVEAAVRLARDRARVVDVGKTRLDLPWNAWYDKELDLRFSRSYGPGRYDPRYELDGIDYPIGYVRWTERRNLACFVDLLARGRLDLAAMVSGVHPVDEAVDVYQRLAAGELPGVGHLFSYETTPDRAAPAAPVRHVVPPPAAGGARPVTGPVRLGFVGAGNYASSMLLPRLAGRPGVELAVVATTRSLSAATAQRRFGFAAVSTDAAAALEDDSIDAVFVVTRHRSHAGLVCRALEAGKAVFVEKPLAIDAEQLDQIVDTVRQTGNDRLMVGFNRRFAPLFTDLRSRFGPSAAGSVVRYAVSAGRLRHDSWYADEQAEGSRFVGEGGHFIDTISWWLGARPVSVHAFAGADPHDVTVGLRFDDGSLADLTYVTSGHPRFPKELFDASGGGRSARLVNFRSATAWVGRRRRTRLARGAPDKGQGRQLDAFLAAVRDGAPMPIPLESLVATTAATLAVERSLAAGGPVAV